MADYEINYSDIRSDSSADGMIITVEVARDGTYLGRTAGIVPGIDYRRKYKEGRRLTLFFDGRHGIWRSSSPRRSGKASSGTPGSWRFRSCRSTPSAQRAGPVRQHACRARRGRPPAQGEHLAER